MRLSTILLIFLLLLVIYSANAQVTIKAIPSGGTGTIERVYDVKIDTIKSYLLVTMPIDECIGDCWVAKRILGYEVIKRYGYVVEWFYLGMDKEPLSKNINVWMSKPVKK